MTTFNKNKLLLFILVLIVKSAFASARNKSDNTVILLDLSDRLLVPGQISRDTAIILSLYRNFDTNARKQLIMTCRNRFSIVVAAQEDSDPGIEELAAELTLDLAAVPPQSRLAVLRSFSAGLTAKIVRIYTLAFKSKSSKDYSGSDVWRYFNEQLPTDLIDAADNTLVVLTDGYFDFEDHSGKLKKGNRYASTYFLKSLPENGWKEAADATNTGLLSVRNKYPHLRVCVTGIYPKSSNQQEVEKLQYFWMEWLAGMGVRHAVVLPSAPVERTMLTFKKLNTSALAL